MTKEIPYNQVIEFVNINVKRLEIRLVEEAIKELKNSDSIHPAQIMFIQAYENGIVKVASNFWEVCLIMEYRDINWEMSMVIIEMYVRLNSTNGVLLNEKDILNFTSYANTLAEEEIKEIGLNTKDGNPFRLPYFSFSTNHFNEVAGSTLAVITIADNKMF